MRTRLNYKYTIFHKIVNDFEFIEYKDTIIVDEICYYYRVMPKIPKVIETLQYNPLSRQAIIVTHNNLNNACLISLQFFIRRKKLIVVANFRSQCMRNGRPNDTEMLRYFATQVLRSLNLKKFKIYVNVGNYHLNLGISNNYGMN